MRVTMRASDLRTTLETVLPAIDRKAPLPSQRAVLLEAGPGDKVAIRGGGSFSYIEAVTSLTVDVEAGGRIAIDGHYLASILRAARGDDEASLELDGDDLRLVVGGVEYALETLPPEDLPAPVEVPEDLPAVETAPLLRALDAVTPAMADDMTRPHIAGVRLAVEDGVLSVVATDGHRLARAALPPIRGWTEVLVPAPAVPAFQRLLEPSTVHLGHDDRWVYVRTATVAAALRVGEEGYPDWRQVVPQDGSRTVRVETAMLLDALRRLRVALDSHDQPLRLSIEEDGLALLVAGQHRAEAAVEAVVTGEPLELGISAQYLVDALRGAQAEEVVLRLGDALAPVVVQAADGDGPLHVVMPMRL